MCNLLILLIVGLSCMHTISGLLAAMLLLNKLINVGAKYYL